MCPSQILLIFKNQRYFIMTHYLPSVWEAEEICYENGQFDQIGMLDGDKSITT